ncbi:MAG TPA: hypothetical protein VK272_06235 [Solirubrobacteraceae bacterium]|nr:hypothetical protein [Solirubrobacteraceae bacterium]
MSRQIALWMLAALLGLVLAAGITWATSQLANQHIGISSEPISAGRRLAPPVAERAAQRKPASTTTSTSTSSAPAPASTSAVQNLARTQSTPSTQRAATSAAEETPPAASERASGPRRSTSSGDDGRDHAGTSHEGGEREGRGGAGSSRARDD